MSQEFKHFSAMFPNVPAETIEEMVKASDDVTKIMDKVGPETATLMLLDLAAQVMGYNNAPPDSFEEMKNFMEYMYKVYSNWEKRESVRYPKEPVEEVPDIGMMN